MRNALLSVLLFTVIMVFVYFFNTSIINLCDNIKMQADEIEFTLEQHDFEESYTQSLELLNSIQNKNFVTSIYLSHQDFDNLINEALKLSTYIIYENETEAHTCINLLRCSTEHIRQLQMPSLENVL